MMSSCDIDFLSSKKNDGVKRKQMVFFSSDRNGGNMNIWMMKPNGKNQRQITFYPEGEFYPADISPDGKNLLFYRYDTHTLESAIYIMPIDGSPPNLEDGLVYSIALAGNYFPDGEKFVYIKWIGHDALFIYDLSDSSSVQISPPNIASWNPQVSPDGKKICYNERNIKDGEYKGGSNIWMMDIDGSNKNLLTPTGFYSKHGRFSHDGTKIFYSSNEKSRFIDDICSVDLNTHNSIAITSYNKIDCYYPCPDTSDTKIYYRFGGGADSDSLSEIVVYDMEKQTDTKLTKNNYKEDKPVVGIVEFSD